MAKVELKQPIVEEISNSIKDAQAVVLVNYSGLTVEQDTILRKELREAGVQYKVYKNTMMKRAFAGTDCEELSQHLEGTNALAISATDATAPARILAKYAKQFPALELIAETGTFVINGAERVIVSQLVRSPGIYYAIAHDKIGKRLFSSTVIPNRGAWLEYETDSNDVFYVRVDRTRKVPITVLIRALGIGTNAEIVELFGEEPKILASFAKDTSTNYQEGLLELYKKIRPGEPLAVESAESLIMAMFFDPRRYDLAKVGRYKFNKKLHFNKRIVGHKLGETVVDPSTGEILAEEGTNVTVELADKIQNAAVPFVWIQGEERKIKVLSSMMVDITAHVDLDCDPKDLGVTELVYYPVLEKILEENDNLEDIKAAVQRDIHDLIPKHITKEDILASINYNMHLEYGIGNDDDIDHLGNRRIRSVGELLQNQYRIGLSRLERVVRERMTTQDTESVSPQSLINIKPVTAAVKEFFGSSQLSQFMDQNNPLGELTHKRRLSALGPGGLSRDRAGFEVRDVHYSHYGRMCPIETPEGPNIGLINSLASYARINEYGFIEAPYRRIDKADPANPVVTDEVVYMTADEEDNYHVAQANEPLDEEGHFLHKNVSGRFREETQEYEKRMFDYMDVSPKMVFSVATALIPFLQNDDANRALMGSNMQRQAVPLLTTEAPVKMVEKLQPEVWDVLEDVIKEHPVMLNRAPTLHRLGIQAFEPILVEGKAIKLHPLVCTAFNADFDGDQMAVHLPLSQEAQAECRFLLLSPNNLLKPSDGGPVAVPSQDMVLGIYYLTQERPGNPGEGKKQLKQILEKVINTHGVTKTAEVLDDIKATGYKYSTRAAMTVSISDMTVPPQKPEMIQNAQNIVDKITKNYKRGLITEEERYKEVVETWKKTDDELTKALLNGLDKYNNIFMMADSGARGSDKQIKQLAGMRGLMADTTGHTIELPIKSNFREGLEVLEYFMSAHGARKGMSDTALRTADSGYLTRRMVDVSQELIVRETDCCENRDEISGMYVKGFMDGKEEIENLQERITGRFSCETITNKDGEVLVKANHMITPKRAARIMKEGVNANGGPIDEVK
uniref:Large ribosomal subunit protein uL10m n=1 Tax=Glossina morsitans morsitans TaxID=37546 RepID=A0A1B0FD27_GLOMM